MVCTGVGVHFGERWVDSFFQRSSSSTAWRDAVEPTVKKCSLAATLHLNLNLNADGSKALGDLLIKMAQKLDRAGVDLD
jgi:hypothetical protein